MSFELRGYQVEAADAVFDAWDKGVFPPPAVILPTGSGKSVTMGEIVRRLYVEPGEGKIVVLAHRGELLKQLKRAVHQLDDSISVGVVKAQTREYDCDVLVASVQTLASSWEHLAEIGDVRAVLVDECHHYAAETYRGVLGELGAFDVVDPTPVVGFTATMWRSDGGLESLWSPVYEKDLIWAIEQGFLVRPRGLVVVCDSIDLSNVRVEAGEYVRSELEEAMMASVQSTVTAMETHCRDRACIVFAAGVDHAYSLAGELSAAGMSAEVVVGSMGEEERQGVYDRFNSGALHSMVTVTVLTEGADFPRCDCVVMARPTRSKSLHSQQVGRALRLYVDPVSGVEKRDALVLDLAGHTRSLSLMDLSRVDDSFGVEFVNPEGDVVDEPEEERRRPPRNQRFGVLQVEEVDLFDPKGSSKRTPRWLQTEAGTLFLPGVERFVFLRERGDGVWFVGWVSARGELLGRFVSEHGSRGEALRAAEELARGFGDLPLRSKSQFVNVAPTERQCEYARVLGIGDPELFTKARLQDEISRVVGLRRLDLVG